MSEQARPPTDIPTVLERVGGFSYLAATDRWEWSDAVARMHGYEPGTVTPTTALILSHKHDEDRLAVAEIIEQVLRGDAPFSSRHRILDTAGHTHHVVVGEHLRDDEDRVIGTTGFYIDITEVLDAQMQQTVTETVAAIEAQRAVINQAIGVIMWTYGVSAERAFEVLTWRSQHTNTKLRRIAAQFLADLTAGAPPGEKARDTVDHLLLTAHIPSDTPHH